MNWNVENCGKKGGGWDAGNKSLSHEVGPQNLRKSRVFNNFYSFLRGDPGETILKIKLILGVGKNMGFIEKKRSGAKDGRAILAELPRNQLYVCKLQ